MIKYTSFIAGRDKTVRRTGKAKFISQVSRRSGILTAVNYDAAARRGQQYQQLIELIGCDSLIVPLDDVCADQHEQDHAEYQQQGDEAGRVALVHLQEVSLIQHFYLEQSKRAYKRENSIYF